MFITLFDLILRARSCVHKVKKEKHYGKRGWDGSIIHMNERWGGGLTLIKHGYK